MCPRYMSRENPTCVKRNPPWQINKAKYTHDMWVKKTWFMWPEIYYDRGARPNVPETHELGKLNPCEEKSTITEAQGQHVWDTWVRKTQPTWRNPPWVRYKANVLETYKSRKPNLREEKSAMMEARGHTKIYLPWRMYEAKYARDMWVRKT